MVPCCLGREWVWHPDIPSHIAPYNLATVNLSSRLCHGCHSSISSFLWLLQRWVHKTSSQVFCDSTFPSAPQRPSVENFTPPFLTITYRILSQALMEAYYSAEEHPAGCAPYQLFPSASWPRSINSLWKVAGLRTRSPRSTWLKPLNDQLGMSHISSPSLGNPASSLCTGLK